MLSIARNNPVLQSEIKVEKIDLIHGDILRINFPEQSFNFVYSVGVLGDYAPLSLALLERIWRWLKYGGCAFLTVMDSASPKGKSWKRSLATFLYPLLPHNIKVYVDIRIGDYTINWRDFEALLQQTSFKSFKIYRQVQRRTFLFILVKK
jgi:ubiquinone/menaquinone biosynthesis C-methylase UbiE